MPISNRLCIDSETFLSVWTIEESLKDISGISDTSKILCDYYSKRFSSESRIIEKVIPRLLLIDLYEEIKLDTDSDSVPHIEYNDDGCPILSNGFHISISHTQKYIAIIVSRRKRVGIDIEMFRDSVKNIVSRFVRHDETTDDFTHLMLLWSAKESVYKLFSEQHLGLLDIRICAEDNSKQNRLCAENMLTKEKSTVIFHVGHDYVLTYAIRCEDL